MGLNSVPIAFSIKQEIEALEHDGAWHLHAGVVMPDHIHLLVSLKQYLTLGQSIGRLKAKTRPALDAVNIRWQGNYYDHQLRANDSIEQVVLYIFLNPYRAKLVSAEVTYPWTWFGTEEQAWFRPMTYHDRPFPEWLQ